MTAIKKNRRENGRRAEVLGSNPHSNGDDFSRSSIIFFDKIEAKLITIVDKIMMNKVMIVIMKIIYLVNTNFLIGSQIYLIY